MEKKVDADYGFYANLRRFTIEPYNADRPYIYLLIFL